MSISQRPGAGRNVHSPEPEDDATIRLTAAAPKPPLWTSRRAWLTGAGILGAACLARGLGPMLLSPAPKPAPPRVAARPAPAPVVARAPLPPPPPEFAILNAGEQEILHNVPTGMTVFRFADDRRILVLDFASLEQQGMMLDRVAALIEKAGSPRNRVLTEDELLQTIRSGGDTIATYYYGHDYAVASLQRFFGYVDAEHIMLEPQEMLLRRLLTQVGWFQPGVTGGLISIPAVGANANVTLSARSAILHHELSHGFFFSEQAYADFVHGFWLSALTNDERVGVRKFLGSEGYDMTYEELMYNEMQAYLMFTRDPQFFTPAMVGMTPMRLAGLQTQFLRGMPTGWLHDSLAATPVELSGPAPAAGAVPKADGRLHAG